MILWWVEIQIIKSSGHDISQPYFTVIGRYRSHIRYSGTSLVLYSRFIYRNYVWRLSALSETGRSWFDPWYDHECVLLGNPILEWTSPVLPISQCFSNLGQSLMWTITKPKLFSKTFVMVVKFIRWYVCITLIDLNVRCELNCLLYYEYLFFRGLVSSSNELNQ